MSQSQPQTPNGEQDNEAKLELPSNPMAGRRQQTTSDFRPPILQQNPSTASSMGRYSTVRLPETMRKRPGLERHNTAPNEMRRRQSNRSNVTNMTNMTHKTSDPYRAEKKQEQTVDIDNEYFVLNPWYNQQKSKPVYGLAAPLPHSVRKGMWWGRGDLRRSLYKEEEKQEDDGVDRNDHLEEIDERGESNASSTPFYVPQDSELPPDQSRPDHLNATVNGRNVNVRRMPTSEANEVLRNRDSDHEGNDRAPVNEHGLSYSGDQGQPQHFGMQDGIPPLQDVGPHETSQTEKEKEEIQHREHEAEQDYYNQYRNPIARLRAQYPQAPAEFLATFIYLFLGICVNLSVATSQSKTGSFETQAWGWGFAVMVGIYMGGGVSGAHLSPTISIALSVYRGFPWRMALVYICMQMLAGLCAGALAFALYRDAIYSVDPGLTLDMTGSALFPKGPSFTTAGGFFNDFVYMAVYVCIAFALGDDQNSPPGQGMTALIFGFTGFVTMVALGYNTGLGISPARDLGPRLIALWVGYEDSFKTGYWAYGPWGASISGALVGGLMYDLFIFVGGESPVNYRWPQPGDIKWKVRQGKKQVKDKIEQVA